MKIGLWADSSGASGPQSNETRLDNRELGTKSHPFPLTLEREGIEGLSGEELTFKV